MFLTLHSSCLPAHSWSINQEECYGSYGPVHCSLCFTAPHFVDNQRHFKLYALTNSTSLNFSAKPLKKLSLKPSISYDLCRGAFLSIVLSLPNIASIKHCLHVCCPPILDGGGVHILAVEQLVIAAQWAGVKTVLAIRDIVMIVMLSWCRHHHPFHDDTLANKIHLHAGDKKNILRQCSKKCQRPLHIFWLA